MQTSKPDKILAAATVLIFLVLVPFPFVFELLAAAILALIYRKLTTPYARAILIKATDLTVTLAIAHFCIFIINAALGIIITDSGLQLPIIKNGLAAFVLKKILTFLYLFSLILLFIKVISGKIFDLPVSFKAIERLNKWRIANL